MNADERRLSWNMRTELLSNLRLSAFICGFILLCSGCGTAVSHGVNTALSGVDLVTMTDQMAMSIATSKFGAECVSAPEEM